MSSRSGSSRLVSKIVRELESLGESEVTTETIGETVMAHLRELDDVAYVRFASVYRNFREAKDFETALAELSGEDERQGARDANSRQGCIFAVNSSAMRPLTRHRTRVYRVP